MKFKKVVLFLLCIVVGAINGLLGGGGGMLCVPMLQFFVNMEDKRAHATAILVMLLSSIASVIIYIPYLKTNLWIFLTCAIGGIIGAVIGAKLLKRLNAKWIQGLFVIVLFVAGFAMIF